MLAAARCVLRGPPEGRILEGAGGRVQTLGTWSYQFFYGGFARA